MLPFWIMVLRYLAAVADDGDYRNDWLTHIPVRMVGTIVHLAHLLYDVIPGDVTYWLAPHGQLGITFTYAGHLLTTALPH